MPYPLPRGAAAACLLAATALIAAEPPPPWAYGFKNVPSAATAPGPAATTTQVTAPPDVTSHRLPGTSRRFTRAEITNTFSTVDWYPADHPSMPEIVAQGKPPAVWSCTRCHYTNGKGRPENAGIAGLPVEYFIGQLHAFRNGERASSDPRKPNTQMMVDYAKAMTEEEIHAAAEYYGAMPWTSWIRVVETERVPQTTISAGMYLQLPGKGDEPLGNRIVEVPEDPDLVEIQRSPRVGFIAYAPVGSIKRGEELVTTGGGKTVACAACHGSDLKGATVPNVGVLPGLAGRSPSYIVRQLFDIQSGKRRGTRVELMKPIVNHLTTDDMLAIAAYLASRVP